MTWPVRSEADTDTALVEAARSGDVASYGRLVERYQAIAHRTAFMMGAGDDTADVVQEALVKAYLALNRFRVGEPFQPWLLRIVANETRNRWRWFSRHRTAPLSLVGDGPPESMARSPEQIAEDREMCQWLRDAVAALPPWQREVVVCRYWLDLSEADTAQMLGIPRGTVKSRLSRGLRAIQRRLDARMASAAPPDRERSGA